MAVEAELDSPRPDHTAVLEEILEAADRLAETVNDLLRLARDTPRRGRTTELAAVLGDLERRWQSRFATGDRALEVTMTTDLAPIDAAAAAASHALVVVVVVDNAMRHSISRVTVTADPSGRDRGHGHR